jgi:hypothetical protein
MISRFQTLMRDESRAAQKIAGHGPAPPLSVDDLQMSDLQVCDFAAGEFQW